MVDWALLLSKFKERRTQTIRKINARSQPLSQSYALSHLDGRQKRSSDQIIESLQPFLRASKGKRSFQDRQSETDVTRDYSIQNS
ncbi:hypothetical protein KCU71_g116, partial [Aureobasidium melanogenum]